MEKKEAKKLKLLPKHLTLSATPMGVFRWRCNPPDSLTLDDLLDPAVWDNVSDKFSVKEDKHQGQVVEVLNGGLEWYAELIVFRLRNGHISIKKLSEHSFNELKPALSANDFEVVNRGNRKWSILRKADGVVIDELIDTREKANKLLEEYVKET